MQPESETPQRPDPTPVPTDVTALLAGLISGERLAWERFEREYGPRIRTAIERVRRRFGAVMSNDDAMEVYSSLCLQLVHGDKRRLRQFDPARGTRFEAWLSRLAVNATYDFLRQRRRQPQLARAEQDAYFGELLPDASPDAFRVAAARQEAAAIAELVADLSPRDQEFIALFFAQGLDPVETAERLGVQVSTVYSKKHKIRARLEDLLHRESAA